MRRSGVWTDRREDSVVRTREVTGVRTSGEIRSREDNGFVSVQSPEQGINGGVVVIVNTRIYPTRRSIKLDTTSRVVS